MASHTCHRESMYCDSNFSDISFLSWYGVACMAEVIHNAVCLTRRTSRPRTRSGTSTLGINHQRFVVHSVSHGNCPVYLKNMVQSASASRPQLRQCLRSTSSNNFELPQLRAKFGECALSHAGPSAWNSLPDSIRTEPNSAVFWKHLKTHFFCSAFNVF